MVVPVLLYQRARRAGYDKYRQRLSKLRRFDELQDQIVAFWEKNRLKLPASERAGARSGDPSLGHDAGGRVAQALDTNGSPSPHIRLSQTGAGS